MEMILMAETIDAAEAYRIGLINKVVPKNQVLPMATEWAEKVCQMGPLAVRAAKACVIRGLDMSLEEGLKLEDHYSEYLFSSEDAKEGPKAFAEKRPPRFVGR
jgi:enoyl-CoA hydratase/carnithine racemase